MTADQTTQLITSLATIGAAIAAGTATPTAATFALSAIIREAPHLFAIGAIVLSKGSVTPEQLKTAHDQTQALLNPAGIPAAA